MFKNVLNFVFCKLEFVSNLVLGISNLFLYLSCTGLYRFVNTEHEIFMDQCEMISQILYTHDFQHQIFTDEVLCHPGAAAIGSRFYPLSSFGLQGPE